MNKKENNTTELIKSRDSYGIKDALLQKIKQQEENNHDSKISSNNDSNKQDDNLKK